jgi:hypothetical protein
MDGTPEPIDAPTQTYRVIRYYRSGQHLPEVTHRGLTEEQALGIVGEGANGNPHAPYFSVYQAEAIE